MKKIVIYDSYFGNTQAIAEAIAEALECDSIKVQIFNEDVINNYDLVVLGSPTRKFKPTKEILDLVKLIKGHGTKVAFFDTRFNEDDELPKSVLRKIKKKGYSNDKLEMIVRKNHVPIAIYSGEFFIEGKEGPLEEKALEKAEEFGLAILHLLEK